MYFQVAKTTQYMKYNTRTRFTSYLRDTRIKYKSFCKIIELDKFFLHFNDDEETVQIISPHYPQFIFHTPYAGPDKLLSKFLQFKHGIIQYTSRQHSNAYNRQHTNTSNFTTSEHANEKTFASLRSKRSKGENVLSLGLS